MKKEINSLAQEVLNHKNLYYSGNHQISDEAYDALEAKLRELAPNHPVLSVVGKTDIDPSLKVKHATRMLSLEKTYSADELSKWVNGEEVVSLFKIDGSSCSIVYENGVMKIAKTRGDGSVGENITSNVAHVLSIPRFVDDKSNFEVRGEIYCTQENFVKLSEEMTSLGLNRPTSQRNIVAGILGRKENISLARFLSFQAFDYISEEKFSLETEKLEKLLNLGFVIPRYQVHKDASSIEERIEEAKSFMNEGDFLIDGLVFVFNRISLHYKLGETSHHPRYKLAFKFQGETGITKIESIDWQVSRAGILTPVANISPVELSGAVITRVTLHNLGQVKTHNLASGDVIEIIRSGEVIPKFLRVVEKSSNNFSHPQNCPVCSYDLSVDGIRLLCLNDNCKGKIREQILNFITHMKIKGISNKRLEEMIQAGLVSNIPDLYRITTRGLLVLNKVKEKLAEKIFASIESSKNPTLAQFISAIGVEGISSESKIEKLSRVGLNSIDKLLDASIEDVMKVDGFAEKSARIFIDSLHLKKELIAELKMLGVSIQESVNIVSSESLKDVVVCITGELSIPRKQMELKIRSCGGTVTSSVSKNTTFLLTNETDSNSSKFTKAKELGVKIINEESLLDLLK